MNLGKSLVSFKWLYFFLNIKYLKTIVFSLNCEESPWSAWRGFYISCQWSRVTWRHDSSVCGPSVRTLITYTYFTKIRLCAAFIVCRSCLWIASTRDIVCLSKNLELSAYNQWGKWLSNYFTLQTCVLLIR